MSQQTKRFASASLNTDSSIIWESLRLAEKVAYLARFILNLIVFRRAGVSDPSVIRGDTSGPLFAESFQKGLYYNKDGERWKLATIAGLVTRMIAIRLDTVTRPFSLKPRGLFSIPLAYYAPFHFRPRFHWRCTPLAGNGWQLKAGGGAYASNGRHTPAAGRCSPCRVRFIEPCVPTPREPSRPPRTPFNYLSTSRRWRLSMNMI